MRHEGKLEEPAAKGAALHILSNMTSTEFAALARRCRSAILPVGATEGHGPHLPLSTDWVIGVETAQRAAQALHAEGIEVLLLPPILYGVTRSTADYPGTVPISEATLAALVKDVCASVIAQGFTNLCITNHHLAPEHLGTLFKVKEELEAEHRARVAVPNMRKPAFAGEPTREFKEGAIHGGSFETSLVLQAQPELVHLDRARTLQPVWKSIAAGRLIGAKTLREAGGVDGYFGDPAAATPAEGEYLYDAMVRLVVQAVKDGLAATA